MEQENNKTSAVKQHEDAALKLTMRFFADELLPYWGIEGKVTAFAPTEFVHLEVKKFLQDFNLVMEDGSWKHFEFQSTNEGTEGMRRFRVYEAVTSYQNKVQVTTYVLFSGTIRNPMIELREGINTYQIIPIIMNEENADQVIAELKRKVEAEEPLSREELVPLSLCMLMGGEMPQKERLKAAFSITSKAVGVSREDVRKIESVVYVMADKFLDDVDMEDVRRAVHMTRLGQMVYEDGIEDGIERGMERGIERGIVEGEERVNRLCGFLLREKRYEDLERATEDKEYQKELFRAYGIL